MKFTEGKDRHLNSKLDECEKLLIREISVPFGPLVWSPNRFLTWAKKKKWDVSKTPSLESFKEIFSGGVRNESNPGEQPFCLCTSVDQAARLWMREVWDSFEGSQEGKTLYWRIYPTIGVFEIPKANSLIGSDPDRYYCVRARLLITDTAAAPALKLVRG